MKNSDFIKLLSTLSKKELRDYHKFLQSSYHDTEPKTLELWKYIKLQYPEFKEPNILKTKAAKVIYGKEQYKTKITNRLAELNKVLQNFLILEHLKDKGNIVIRDFLIEEILGKRGLTHLNQKQLDKIERKLENQFYGSRNHYFYQYKLAQKRYYIGENPQKPNEGKPLKESAKYLRHFCLLENLKLVLEMKIRQKVFGNIITFQESEIQELLQQSKDNKREGLNIYRNFILLQNKVEQPLYEETKKMVLNNLKQVERQEQSNWLTHLINYQSNQLTSTNPNLALYEEILMLHKTGLEENIFTDGKYWSTAYFTNAIVLFCEVKKVNSAKLFLEENIKKITDKKSGQSSYRNRIKNFCKSRIAHAEKDYLQAYKYVKKVRPTNTRINLQSWTIEIKILYELRENCVYFDHLVTALDSFYAFIGNNKNRLGADTITCNRNFIQYAYQLLQANSKPSKKKLYLDIREDLNKVICSKWLLEKASEGVEFI